MDEIGGVAENINKHDNKQYIAQLYQTITVTNITNIKLRINTVFKPNWLKEVLSN